MKISVGFIPWVGAIIIASIAGCSAAQPFCPIDVPKELDKFAIPSLTPRFLVWISILIGMVAALDLDMNANDSAGNIFL